MKLQRMEEMVCKYQNLIYTICFQMIKDEQQAQDLTQETFVSAWLHMDSCDIKGEKAWLCRIAMNKCKDYLKSALVRKVSVCEGEVLDTFVSPQQPLQVVAESRFGCREIANMIYEMKEPYRSVCEAILLWGYSPVQTAEMLCRPVQTVRTQIFRGKKLLQSQLSA